MNLYVNLTPVTILGHVCSEDCGCTGVEVVDADGIVVGYVSMKVARYLVTRGVAMDVTPPVSGNESA